MNPHLSFLLSSVFAPPPPPAPPAGPPAFGTFAREFLERRKVFGSNAHYLDQKSLVETHLVPFFGETRRLHEITIEDVERFVAHVKTRPGVKGEAMSAVG
jgi:hypothetical protein